MYNIICWHNGDRSVIAAVESHVQAVTAVNLLTDANTDEYWFCYRLKSIPISRGWTGIKSYSKRRKDERHD